MQKKLICLIGIFLILATAACGKKNILFLQQKAAKLSQAQILQKSCQRHGIDYPEVEQGDFYYESAQKFLNEGKEEEGLGYADRAVILYRLALAKHDLEKSQQELKMRQATLDITKEQLNLYKGILEEVKEEKER